MLTEEGLADYTRANLLQTLGDALRAMHGREDWAWILRGAGRIHAQAIPARDKAARLQPVEALVALGEDMMRAAEHDRYRTDVERATLYRDGLLVAFLIRRPLRMKNVAAIWLGERLSQRGADWWLSFEQEDMKAGRQFECSWPPELTYALECYLSAHRLNLLGPDATSSASEALWVSRNGTAMNSLALSFRIKHRTQEAFGTAINPHLFRDIAATTIATADPMNVADAARVLGHARLATTEKHYIHARMEVASHAYQAAVTAARGEP
ncbi:MAG: tyrosine-type recombinase/integrase [Caulobacter sp.]|nr:tyrosine-type recombinase/integrase [Caulobacter sp.]